MKTVAICVGHSRPRDSGAVNTSGVTEHTYNSVVAHEMAAILREQKVKALVYDKYMGNSYGAAMRWLAAQLSAAKADIAVELHFNSSDSPTSTGHEWLYWFSSKKGELLASNFDESFSDAFSMFRRRGLKPITVGDRGWQYLQYTHCPSVICEPYFGSNKSDTDFFARRQKELANVYANAVSNYLSSQ